MHRLLGKGGFGLVYLVRDQQGDIYALKTYRVGFYDLRDHFAVKRAFKKEALLWVNIEEHPFILKALWIKEFHGMFFVVMDYIAPDERGRVSLADHLASAGGPLDKEQVLEWAIQFCLGMEHAAAHGIRVHRDIKPENILITYDRRVQIADFGLAAAAEAGQNIVGPAPLEGGKNGYPLSLLQTQGVQICGTPGYISPETYEGKGSSVQSDIYAFGLVLWQMAVGSHRPPFHPEGCFRNALDYQDAVYRLQQEGRFPEVKDPLQGLIARCLQVDPANRCPDFASLRIALEPLHRSITGRAVFLPETGEKSAAFWNNKGTSFAALGLHVEALSCYEEAIKIDPQDALYFFNIGLSLSDLDRHEEALCSFAKALEIDPRYVAAWHTKGFKLAKMGFHEEAIRCYDEVIKLDPRNINAWYNKSCSLAELGLHEDRFHCHDEALKIDPQNYNICQKIALIHFNEKRYEEAMRYFDQILKFEPLDKASWFNKVSCLARLGRHEDAIHYCDKYLKIKPRDTDAWNDKGLSLAKLGRHEEALSCYDEALKIGQRDAHAWVNYVAWLSKGLSLAKLGRHEQALSCYDEALEYESQHTRDGDAEARNSKGSSLSELGLYEEALRCFNKVIEIDPQNYFAWYNKAVNEENLGQRKDASLSFQKFIELAPHQYAQYILYARQRLRELE